MWLINTENYTLHELHGPSEDYPYAILSHTWEESEDDPLQKEVAFLDMRNLNEARTKSGWTKVERICELARRYEPSLKWAWIDTCCIDKSSSAELTEAINSMFLWYRQAKVCFVYLNDLPRSPTTNPETRSSQDHMNDFFPRCRWFTRGWTLQELIAPSKIEFYDTTWRFRGTKTELKRIISTTTGIDQSVLDDSENLPTVPVGRRMSWISKRNTKRAEDIAYCLFGIFDVNMPLIYGERDKAFIRLQTAIAQATSDLSLFAWSVNTDYARHDPEAQTYYGIFAQSHHFFKCCNHLIALADPLLFEHQSFTVTNRGLEFQACLKGDLDEGDYMMNLFCQTDDVELTGGKSGLMVIRLVRTLNGFARHYADKLLVTSDKLHTWFGSLRSVLVPVVINPSDSRRLEARLQNAYRFRIQSPTNISVELLASLGQQTKLGSFRPRLGKIQKGPHSWDWVTKTFLTGGYPMFTGLLWPKISGGGKELNWPHDIRIVFGFSCSLNEKRRPNAESGASLQPWLALIASRSEFINIDEDSSVETFNCLKSLIEEKQPYGPAISALGSLVRQTALDGFKLPKSAMLTPFISGYRDEKQEEERTKLSLILKNVEESGIMIHEVIIRLEYIEPGKVVATRERR